MFDEDQRNVRLQFKIILISLFYFSSWNAKNGRSSNVNQSQNQISQRTLLKLPKLFEKDRRRVQQLRNKQDATEWKIIANLWCQVLQERISNKDVPEFAKKCLTFLVRNN